MNRGRGHQVAAEPDSDPACPGTRALRSETSAEVGESGGRGAVRAWSKDTEK